MEVSIVRGDSCVLQFTITEAYDADGNPLASLTGLSWKLQARSAPDATQVLFEKSSAGGTITANGFVVNVKIAGADTANLGGQQVWCDLQATDTLGRNATVFVQGSPTLRLNILRDITQ